MKRIPLTRGYFAQVSDRDYALLRKVKWWFSGGYAVRGRSPNVIFMHRLIGDFKGIPKRLQVDHRDGDRLNNSRRNLRPATHQQNGMNRHSTVAVSGVRGVYATGPHWIARLRINGRLLNLGTFDTIAKAARIRRRAEKKYFGRFAS